MLIEKINIHDFRVIRDQSINVSDGMNVFYGSNGSGKTSLLEAINVALTGKSFRTSKINSVINNKSKDATVYLKTSDKENAATHSIGYCKDAKQSHIVLDGKTQKAISSVARLLPVQVVDPSSFNILNGPPDDRRRFLDWLVFHVEHSFLEHWKRYKNTLKQRNSLLRRGRLRDGELSVWDTALVLHGIEIHNSRVQQIKELEPYLLTYLNRFELCDIQSVELRYLQGWDKSITLNEAFKSSTNGDIEKGYTRYGPHRADLKLLVNSVPANEYLSRGQQKAFHICLKLAQSQVIKDRVGKKSIYLLDDITSELDEQNLQKVYQCLYELDAQLFITTLECPKQTRNRINQSIKMFHVEHGEISCID